MFAMLICPMAICAIIGFFMIFGGAVGGATYGWRRYRKHRFGGYGGGWKPQADPFKPSGGGFKWGSDSKPSGGGFKWGGGHKPSGGGYKPSGGGYKPSKPSGGGFRSSNKGGGSTKKW